MLGAETVSEGHIAHDGVVELNLGFSALVDEEKRQENEKITIEMISSRRCA